MWELLKDFFKDKNEKTRIPEVLGLLVLLLLIYKFALKSEFSNIFTLFINGLGSFKFIIYVFEPTTIMLTILSIVCLLAVTLSTLFYLIISIIADKKKKVSRRLSDLCDNAQRFYLGSKRAKISVDIWFIVIACYFYIFDEGSFIKYKDILMVCITNANIVFQVFLFLYGIFIVTAFFRLINRIRYKFLYFRMDEETEKKLYEAKNDT